MDGDNGDHMCGDIWLLDVLESFTGRGRVCSCVGWRSFGDQVINKGHS